MSLANGGFGQHRRHESEGIRLAIVAPGCRSNLRRSTSPTVWQAGQRTSRIGCAGGARRSR